MEAADLLQRLWVATLALTAAIVVVAALRVAWRRAFGAGQACRLWWLPPLAVVVSQLPHAAAPVVVLPMPSMPAVYAVMPHVAAVTTSNSVDWTLLMTAAWAGGVLLCLLLAAWRQWRFTRGLHGATVLPTPSDAPLVLRLADARGGPALVGAWRPRIVVPADFEQRYDADERALILAHESAHARRRDGLACALGTLVQALFWFHPLAWWALYRFRRDQELACDAAVLEQHPHARRSYAMTLFKTQTATPALPAGCPWLGGHPIKERIAMLKLSSPRDARRWAGHAAIALVMAGASAVVYAAQQPVKLYHPSKAMVAEALDWSTGARAAVGEYMHRHADNKPSNNEQAGMDAADKIQGDAVKSLTIRAGGVIDVQLRDAAGHDAGNVQLTPPAHIGKGSYSYACTSPNIPDIHTLEPTCDYAPKSASRLSQALHAAPAKIHTYTATTQAVGEAIVLSNGMQMAVLEYARHHAWQLPADNAAAQLPPAGLIVGNYVRQTSVRDGVITAELRDIAHPNKAAGHVRLVPHVDAGGTSLAWTCESPDIPDIAALKAGCVYQPGPAPTASAPPSPTYRLALSIKRGDTTLATPVVCVRPERRAAIEATDKQGKPAWRFSLKARDLGNDRVQMSMDGTITDTDGKAVRMHPVLRGAWDKVMSASITPIAGGEPFTVSVTPGIGCPQSGA